MEMRNSITRLGRTLESVIGRTQHHIISTQSAKPTKAITSGEHVPVTEPKLNEKPLTRMEGATEWVKENPIYATAMIGSGVVALAPMLVATPLLAAGGFAATGPVAGSIAAVAQSSIGSVAAGSAFAVLQSAGMGGAGLAVVNGCVAAGAAGVSLVTGVLAVNKKRGETGAKEENGSKDEGDDAKEGERTRENEG